MAEEHLRSRTKYLIQVYFRALRLARGQLWILPKVPGSIVVARANHLPGAIDGGSGVMQRTTD